MEVSQSCKDSLLCLKDVANEPNVPSYVKLIVELLFETKEEIKQVNHRNSLLQEELHKLREENALLKQKLGSHESSTVRPVAASLAVISSDSASLPSASPAIVDFEELERKRSIVISGVRESTSNAAFERIVHDFSCTQHILDFLKIECLPVTVYRMGKVSPTRPRLLKVVLPCSRLQKEVIRFAPRLRFFPHKGIYIRPSLTLEERNRLRADRKRNAEELAEGRSQLGAGAQAENQIALTSNTTGTSTSGNL